MVNTNIANFRKNIFSFFEQAIKYNKSVSISTKDGNAVLISEEEYNGLRETICLSSIPDLREKTIEGLHTPLDDCSRVILSSGIEKGREGYLLYMKTALANDLSRFKEVIVRLERSDMAYTADKVVELFSSPADCGGFVSFTW